MKKLLIALVLFGFLYGEENANYINYTNPNDKATYSAELIKVYKVKTCHRGYVKLRKDLKSLAKEHCKSIGWTGKLKLKAFTKMECTKIKRKHHKTKVKVKGYFRAKCRFLPII